MRQLEAEAAVLREKGEKITQEVANAERERKQLLEDNKCLRERLIEAERRFAQQ